MEKTDTVILGAGLAGLAAARALGGRAVIYEKEDRPGGLCRSFEVNGFTFDLTGHLLHLKNDRARPVLDRLQGECRRIERNAAVHVDGRYLEFPIQVHTHALAPATVIECLVEFIEARKRAAVNAPGEDFAGWVRDTFGRGLASLFFIPYNTKFWKLPLDELTAEWASWSIPRPGIPEVVDGALGGIHRGLGYNPWFLYPVSPGIETLVRFLCSDLPAPVVTGRGAASVDFEHKVVTFDNGAEIGFRNLVSTMPLPELIRMSDAPAELKAAAGSLRWIQVLDVNLGVERPDLSPYHWVYFPEEKFPFYRVGFFSTISPESAPAGMSSLYAEVSFPSGGRPETGPVIAAVVEGLERAGILARGDRIAAVHSAWIDPAYVVYDRARTRTVGSLLDFLESRGVRSIGRLGRWEYASMSDALAQGLEAGGAIALEGKP